MNMSKLFGTFLMLAAIVFGAISVESFIVHTIPLMQHASSVTQIIFPIFIPIVYIAFTVILIMGSIEYFKK